MSPSDSPKEDVRFLALLVHRGHLDREQAERLLADLRAGGSLDALLEALPDWDADHVATLRRTDAGEIPEIPGYQVLDRLGTGGTASVFRAREKRSGKLLALKVLKQECVKDPAMRKAFVSEARMLERLEHPGLLRGYGVAKFGRTYFAKLELVDGRTLLEILDDGSALGEEAALRAVLEVAETLRYLATEGIVHRDVKPGNIMLSSSGRMKLIDLGFAAEGEEAPPAPSESAVGTVAYLSPEQARGGASADIRSDIYSLGVTLFHLVVGRLPFESSDDRELLRMQVMESLSSPELKGRGLSPHLHYFVEKMMAKDAEVRYQDWAELIDDIRENLEGRSSLDYARRSPAAPYPAPLMAMDEPAADRGRPGLSGVVPFRFACHRCGHCCTGGAGFVWVEDDELEGLASAKGVTQADFVRDHVKRVRDPKSGRERLSLRERETGGSGGPCSLLEDGNHCSVYTARPRHCSQFPFWPSVLEDEAAFERARAVCPGIAVEADEPRRAEAFRRLEELYAEVDAFLDRARPVCIVRGVCCRFEEAGHELYATALEADFAADRHPNAPAPEAPGRCPYHQGGLCTAREGRPLGCRTYFCDKNTESVLQEAHEFFLRRVREIERDCGYPVAYGRFPALLEARGIGEARDRDE